MRSLSDDIEKVYAESSSKETFEKMEVCLERGSSFLNTLKKKEAVVKDLVKYLKNCKMN